MIIMHIEPCLLLWFDNRRNKYSFFSGSFPFSMLCFIDCWDNYCFKWTFN